MTKDRRVTFRLSNDLYSELVNRSEGGNLSISDLTRSAVEEKFGGESFLSSGETEDDTVQTLSQSMSQSVPMTTPNGKEDTDNEDNDEDNNSGWWWGAGILGTLAYLSRR